MKKNKSMKSKITELATVTMIMGMGFLPRAFAQDHGGADRGGNGGDGMEAQFSAIATNINSWILTAKENNKLGELIQMNNQESEQLIQSFGNYLQPGHIQFTDDALIVTNSNTNAKSSSRVCIPEQSLIKCNRKLWSAQNMTQNYYTVFHEILAANGLEPNVGELSNYRFSRNLFALVPKSSRGGVVNKETGEKIELVKIDNSHLLFTLSIEGTVEPISEIFSTKNLSNFLASPKDFLVDRYINPFSVTETVWDWYNEDGSDRHVITQLSGALVGFGIGAAATASGGTLLVFMIAPGVAAVTLPTIIDIAKLPVVGAIDGVIAIQDQHRANKIKKAMSRSLKGDVNSETLVKSKVFNWIKDAVSKVK